MPLSNPSNFEVADERRATKLVIFDLGGVVFRHSFDHALAHWATKSGTAFDDLKRRFSHDEAYALHETNHIGIAEYKDHVCRVLGMTLSLNNFIDGWNAIFEDEVPGVRGVVEHLKKTRPVAVLSNTNHTHCEFIKTKFADVLATFDRVFYSHEIRARKPDREAYQTVLGAFGVAAEQALFLDDLSENIEGARAVGLQTVHVRDFATMVAGLRDCGLG